MSETLNRATGKWAQPGVPHKGWTCVDVEDLEEPSGVCEMCEVSEIRYVHVMEHPDYPDRLGCGCVCAGHMEQDYRGAQRREKTERNKSARRRKWLTRTWRVSQKGNSYLNVDGYNVTVFQAADGWRFRVLDRATRRMRPGRDAHLSEDAAKLAAFKGLEWVKEQQSK